MKKVGAVTAVVVLAVVLALVLSRGAPSSGRPDLSHFTSHGRSVAIEGHEAELVATRDGEAFYRYPSAGRSCFAVGPADRIGSLGGEACIAAGTFPSSAHPLLDLSVYESTTRDRDADMTLFRIEGFAADDVAAVGVLNRAGKVGLRVPVTDNVYVLSRIPPGLTGSVVPLDSDGAKLGASTF